MSPFVATRGWQRDLSLAVITSLLAVLVWLSNAISLESRAANVAGGPSASGQLSNEGPVFAGWADDLRASTASSPADRGTMQSTLAGDMTYAYDATLRGVVKVGVADFYNYDSSSRSVRAHVVSSPACVAAEDGGGFLSEIKGRISAARMGGSDSGAISLGGNEFSDDEIAQLTYQHIGEGDIPGRPSLDEISAALKNSQPVSLPGQNAVQYEYGGVRVIVNGDAPWRSTAYYQGR